MYRDRRPAPLNTDVAPGRHRPKDRDAEDEDARAFVLLLLQGKCPVTLDKDPEACSPSRLDSLASAPTSPDMAMSYFFQNAVPGSPDPFPRTGFPS